jgi:hypothetical protein
MARLKPHPFKTAQFAEMGEGADRIVAYGQSGRELFVRDFCWLEQ